MIERELLKSVSNEQIVAAIARWKLNSELTQRALLDGRQLALHGGTLNEEVLVGLEMAISEGASQVAELALLIAQVLLLDYQRAGSLVARLIDSKRTQGRCGALRCLTPGADLKVVTCTLKALLQDKSKKVREMTVDWISRNNERQFLPMLIEAFDREADSALKTYMDREIRLLSCGYHVSREEGTVYVTLQDLSGRAAGYLGDDLTANLSDQEIAKRFAAQLRV